MHRLLSQFGMIAVFLLCSVSVFAQLPAFTLNVAHTNETCPGNGTLTFSTLNTDPAATVTYSVYELPNTTTAIAVQTTTTLGGLTEGDYRVIATQTLGADSNTQTQNIHINNNLTLLAYTIAGTDITCNNNGTMTINVFQGTGVLYEIISGPVIRAPQSSNIFSSLPPGQYEVRVFDNCGEGWVATHSLFYDSTFSVEEIEPQQQALVSCTETTISTTVTPPAGHTLSYPLTVVYTIYPPGGGTPQVITSTVTSGDPDEIEIQTVIPYYDTQTYSYSYSITDACGKTYQSAINAATNPLIGIVNKVPAKCGKFFLSYVLENYLPPLNIQFLQAPADFNPSALNPQHPGPFPSSPIKYGEYTIPVPFGFYSAVITDGCGRSVTLDIELIDIPPNPTVTLTPNNGCQSNTSLVKIRIQFFPLVNASVTLGPATFSTTYPVDVSSFINSNGELVMENVPEGYYEMTIIDECSNSYPVTFTVAGLNTQVTLSSRNGCELGKGSARIRGVYTSLVSAIIMNAPPEFGQTLPFDASFNITPSGTFSMNNLPPGNYLFKVKDDCGVEHTRSLQIDGYAVTNNTYAITEHCGSFDLLFINDSNGTTSEKFFLQKRNPSTNTWGHPQTNVPYVTGTALTSVNSLPVDKNSTNFNITYLGDFRILKRYETYENGSVGEFKDCIDVIQEFTFTNAIRITDIEKTTCSGLNSNVQVTALGVAPLHYEIISKNGLPFSFDNFGSNAFANLEPAVYMFQVTDICNNVGTRLVDIGALPSLVRIAAIPQNMVACDGDDNDDEATFDLSLQNPVVLGSQSPANYTVSYHTSLQNAVNNVDPLPLSYTSISRTIHIRLTYNTQPNCYELASFNIIVNPYPEVNISPTNVLCAGKTLTLTADGNYTNYLWSTGETTKSIVVDQPGTYTVTASQTLFGVTCTASASTAVILSGSAKVDQIITTDFTTDDNTIQVILSGDSTGHYTFSLDNIRFQESPIFYGLPAGSYTVYIKDENGCDPVEVEAFLLTYPKFFTPNGDGYNDFWQVKFSFAEPTMKIYIFDRYGKLLTGFNGASIGWDGKYNGAELPSTDYWFYIIRPDGREYRGHFAMKR